MDRWQLSLGLQHDHFGIKPTDFTLPLDFLYQGVILILGILIIVTSGQLRFPKRLDLNNLPRYDEQSLPGEVLNNTLENFCRDVSVFSQLKFKETERERLSRRKSNSLTYLGIIYHITSSCVTNFAKICVERWEQVCLNVTEIHCEVSQ